MAQSPVIHLRGVDIGLLAKGEKPTPIVLKPKQRLAIPEKFNYQVKEPVEQTIIINRFSANDRGAIPYTKAAGKLRCMYTLEPIEHIPVGIPVSKEVRDDKTVIFYCVDVFDTFSDALAEVQRRKANPKNEMLYSKSEAYLKELFAEYYPGHILRPSQDNRLLKIFNGPLDIDEFRKVSYYAHGVQPNYIQVPVQNVLTYME